MDQVTIGGEKHKICLYEYLCFDLLKRYNKIISDPKYQRESSKKLSEIERNHDNIRKELKALLDGGLCTKEEYQERLKQDMRDEAIEKIVLPKVVPDTFVYWCVWKLLKKSGIWPFRKPFRSARHMRRRIIRGEGIAIMQLVMREVFGYRVNVDDEESIKKKIIN